jgi:hypothetical protein
LAVLPVGDRWSISYRIHPEMREEILTYREMCDREGIQTLQRGMNYRLNSGYSVVLMSRRPNAPYTDRILEDERTIEYEGHDASRTTAVPKPKDVDQPLSLPSGKPTQNGLFIEAVEAFRRKESEPELVRVYEKLFAGVWSDKGLFELVDYTLVPGGKRKVFKFYLKATERSVGVEKLRELPAPSRLIPAEVKKEVWRRDKGRCVLCGAGSNLHFDHDIPWSKGGASISAANVRILCARHNIQKSNKIE